MSLFLMKWALTALVVWLGDVMLPDVFYPNVVYIVITSLVLVLVGYVMERIMLHRGTLWITTIADWAVSAGLIYLSQFVFAGAQASTVGALLTGGLIGISEYFMHRHQIRKAIAARYR
jgi:hypothetical protein